MSEKTAKLEERYGRSENKFSPVTKLLISLALVGFFSFAIYSTFIAKPLASVEVTS